jgi:hypothetical protein
MGAPGRMRPPAGPMVTRELSTTTPETEPFLSMGQRRSTSLSRSALAIDGSVSDSIIGYLALCVLYDWIGYNDG